MTTVYEAAGGAPALVALAEAWHVRVLADPVVAHAFKPPLHVHHTGRLAGYWGAQLGGPAEGVVPHDAVVRLHSGNGPHDEMDARAIACFVLAMDDAGLPADDRLRDTLTAWFTWANESVNHEYESPDDVPAGLPVPRWDWGGPVDAPAT